MLERRLPGSKLYRLEVSGDECGTPRTIEFAAEGRESAFCAAQRYGSGQDIRVFEDGRSLGCLRLAVGHGFWMIAPELARAF